MCYATTLAIFYSIPAACVGCYSFLVSKEYPRGIIVQLAVSVKEELLRGAFADTATGCGTG